MDRAKIVDVARLLLEEEQMPAVWPRKVLDIAKMPKAIVELFDEMVLYDGRIKKTGRGD